MSTTKQIAPQHWTAFFDDLSRRQLTDESPKAATVEVLSPSLGDQIEVLTTRVLGLGYDRQRETFSILLDDVADHMVSCLADVWVIEEEDGLVSTVELACTDGRKEIVYLWRSGPLAPLPAPVELP
jgi:hypothetical protein